MLDALAFAGVYRSQFGTGTSNGGLIAHPGGERWNWESRRFGGTCDRPLDWSIEAQVHGPVRSGGKDARS